MELIKGVKLKMELSELFRYTRRMRGDGAEELIERFGIDAETLSEWEYGIGITDEAADVMREYVKRDTDCYRAFVEQLKATHCVIVSMIKSFGAGTPERFIKRREFKESMDLLKQFYCSLNEYEKKYILRGFDTFLSFETNPKTLNLIFNDDTLMYKEVLSSYIITFMRAKSDINGLLELYGMDERVNYGDIDFTESETISRFKKPAKKLALID